MSLPRHIICGASHGRPDAQPLRMCTVDAIVIAGMAGSRRLRRPAGMPVSTVAVGSFRMRFEGWGTARTRLTLLFSSTGAHAVWHHTRAENIVDADATQPFT